MAREALACFSAPSNIPEKEICFAIVTDPENKGALCWKVWHLPELYFSTYVA